MSDEKKIPMTERLAVLETELKKLTAGLAQKNREIEVERALEKVREKALAMRNSSELSETSTVVFQQLKELKIEAVRTGLGIFDDESNAIELWVTSVSSDGKLYFILDYINIHVHPVFEKIIEGRKEQKTFVSTSLGGKELLNYYRTVFTHSAVPGSGEININTVEYYYSFFFLAGTINVVSRKALTDEEQDIMIRMANVFGLIYIRFLDLKKLEEQAVLINDEKKALESTLDNLKATQAKLVHSEKMASLGELTAGIAHEIQNPLNFVNNFSDISNELIEEMKGELSGGNMESAIEIADDVKQNLEKILHHGKRADAIVKNMLQHSSIHSGKKEPTDINALVEEYLRLSYHGLRVKDKSFNAKFETDLDHTLEKINIVPQQMGRVLLNLINNAFYAVNEKQKHLATAGYEPTVRIVTKKRDKGIEITVMDNGNGIPQKIVDKIFQPFFTTKPTGQGTGLGLSLAYDIITKGHGGELKVETNEGAGSQFTIHLPAE